MYRLLLSLIFELRPIQFQRHAALHSPDIHACRTKTIELYRSESKRNSVQLFELKVNVAVTVDADTNSLRSIDMICRFAYKV
jgi:hypothetical protein